MDQLIAYALLGLMLITTVASILALVQTRRRSEQELSTQHALDDLIREQSAQRNALDEMRSGIAQLATHAANTSAAGRQQFDTILRELSNEREQSDRLRREVVSELQSIRQDTNAQLDRMRGTVDEKLQQTLSERITESFALVNDQLKQVDKGLGEMQALATGVGDLKRVLSNVKTRGILGEVQLGAILYDILAPEQYLENVATKPGSTERVEFAVKLPVRGGDPVLLPIDAKFPGDTYDHLRQALDEGDAESIAAARRTLETVVRTEAKSISEKYISVPETTNFAILFLPFEGLYAEVVNRPGLIERLQHEYHVSVAGPSTMAALLNSLQMSYQTFAFQERADEVQRILQAVKAEFPKYQKALKQAYDQINRAGKTIDNIMTTRTNVIERKLNQISTLEDAEEAEQILGIDGSLPGSDGAEGTGTEGPADSAGSDTAEPSASGDSSSDAPGVPESE